VNPLLQLKTVTLRAKNVVLLFALTSFLCPSLVFAASVQALFGLSAPQSGPFPSDHFTNPDPTQNTGLRIALPKPDCAIRPSDCEDIDVLNELDGFNLQPRLSIPFDGLIDVASVTSESVFLVSLGSTLPGGNSGGRIVGIDQVVWDTFTNTLYVESDELLDQNTRYVLVVTKKVTDAGGKSVKAANAFLDFVDDANSASTGDPALDAYRASLRNALDQIDTAGVVSRGQVVSASLFTTLSATADLEKMRDQIKAAAPPPAHFLLGLDGSRTVFSRSAMIKLEFNRQTSANPSAPLAPITLDISVLDVVTGVGKIAYGRYSSPDYQVHPGEFIPSVGTLSGTPLVRGSNNIIFSLVLPSNPKPAAGYPVAVFGHGGGGKNMSGLVAAKLAEQGIATIAIDAPGFGFGPASTYKVTFADLSSVTFPSGGRSIDQNGNGQITNGEGSLSALPWANLDIGGRDAHRQWAVDHMQLVREIEVGMDVDGDAVPDLDPSRIYYVGESGGGRQGAIFLAVEPNIRAGVVTVPNAAIEERLSAGRGGFPAALQRRTPSVINSPGITCVNGIQVSTPYFDENLPLRYGAPYSVVLQDRSSRVIKSPVENTIPDAVQIQQVLENIEWVYQPANSVAYASFIRRRPLNGVPAKAVIIQFAHGDRSVPNPSTTTLLRAGDLADRATFYRADLRFAENPNANLYPHGFMSFGIQDTNLAVKDIALRAQQQIALFFAMDGPNHIRDPFDGTQITDPDGTEPVFEVPVVLPLPITLNYDHPLNCLAFTP
jgi:Bacterial virulence factor lipase N-terminal